MKQITRLFIFLFLLIQTPAFSCSCAYVESFCETIFFNNSEEVLFDLIVLGEKKKDTDVGMQIEVLDVLHGMPEGGVITVLRGGGYDCRVDTKRFDVGDKLVLALSRNWEDPGKYDLGLCGVTFLEVKGDQVTGPIDKGKNKMAYSRFRTHCGLHPLSENAFRVYPNPTRNVVFLESANTLEGTEVILRWYDAFGRAVAPDQVLENIVKTSSIPINLPTHLAAGVYTLELILPFRREKHRLIIAPVE